MNRQWDRWSENQVQKLATAEDRPAEVWSAFLYCRKAIPGSVGNIEDTDPEGHWDEFRKSVAARITIGIWGVVTDIVAELEAHQKGGDDVLGPRSFPPPTGK